MMALAVPSKEWLMFTVSLALQCFLVYMGINVCFYTHHVRRNTTVGHETSLIIFHHADEDDNYY